MGNTNDNKVVYPYHPGPLEKMQRELENKHRAASDARTIAFNESLPADQRMSQRELEKTFDIGGSLENFGISIEEKTILDVLKNEHPMAVTQEDLAAVTRLSDRTVRKCLKRLREKLELTHRPLGPKKGETLTPKGLKLMRR